MDFKTRRYKPSELQKQQLLDLVKSNWSNLHLASKSEKGEIWNEISETLNRSAVAKYQHKTMQQWRKCWSDRITKAKRRLFVLKRNRYLHTQNQNVTLAANAEELEIIQEYGDDLLGEIK